MTSHAVVLSSPQTGVSMKALVVGFGVSLLLAGCATQPMRSASLRGSRFDPRLGVSASERVVADGQAVPRGGGGYLTGRPYQIAGRSYFPQQHAEGYTAVGTASWYGDAFHGRRTANGEIFDKGSISAAHPTLPLPSYVRVTNLSNGRSMIVRVNDRGPYHGNRVMDVSQRVADTLDFRRAGTARIRVDYVGRAGLAGSDDEKLLATLRTDGGPAQMAGYEKSGGGGDLFAALTPGSAPDAPPAPQPQLPRIARAEERRPPDESIATPMPVGTLRNAPLPPVRPYDVSEAQSGTVLRAPRSWRDRVAAADGR